MNLLYIVFGTKERYHYEAIFSILSFLAKNKGIEHIFVYTDAPNFYKCLDTKITIKKIDAFVQNDWKGKHNYFFRTKIKAIEDLHTAFPSKPLVYLDADTFLYKDRLDFLFTSLTADEQHTYKAFMHKKESLLSEGKSSKERKMWKRFSGKTFGGITIHASHAMWNAGFIALPVAKRKDAIELALNICDDLCENMSTANFRSHTLEQFAFSVALQENYKSDLLPVEDFVGHYWCNKDEWDLLIRDYLALAYVEQKTPEDMTNELAHFNFNQLPIQRRAKNIRIKLTRLIRSYFPDKDIQYL